jgi:hypothetical protein
LITYLDLIQSVIVDCTSVDKNVATQLYSLLRQSFVSLQNIFSYLLCAVKVLLDPLFFSDPSVNLDLAPGYQELLIHFRAQRGVSQNRINQGDFGLQHTINVADGPLNRQIENAIINNVASLFTRVINSKFLSVDQIFSSARASSMEATLIVLVAGGGWPVSLRVGSIVDLFPRALFLNSDPKSLEQVVFPSAATVHTLSSGLYGRPCGVWVNRCAGGYIRFSMDPDTLLQRDDVPPLSLVIPRSEKSLLPATEMISPRDTHIPLGLFELIDLFKKTPVGTSEYLSNLLRSLAVRGSDSIDHQPSHQEDSLSALALTICMAQMRCLLVQLTNLDSFHGENRIQHAQLLTEIFSRDLTNIISIASIDPVSTVVDAFKAKVTNHGLNSSGQLDVLSNLLREGDLIFLERITLRIWRHFQPKSPGYKSDMSPGPSPLAGEVQIAGNRIRALGHFPSVRILPVNLEKMTGRWFYECSLLSDGLMQIGWADKSFRCDPVCGQGVGDHLHSWAIDGLR